MKENKKTSILAEKLEWKTVMTKVARYLGEREGFVILSPEGRHEYDAAIDYIENGGDLPSFHADSTIYKFDKIVDIEEEVGVGTGEYYVKKSILEMYDWRYNETKKNCTKMCGGLLVITDGAYICTKFPIYGKYVRSRAGKDLFFVKDGGRHVLLQEDCPRRGRLVGDNLIKADELKNGAIWCGLDKHYKYTVREAE